MRKIRILALTVLFYSAKVSAQFQFGQGGGGTGNILRIIWNSLLAFVGFLFSLILPQGYQNPAGFAAFLIVFLIFYAGYTIFVNAADATFYGGGGGTPGTLNEAVLGLSSPDYPSSGALSLSNYIIWLSLLTLVMLNVRDMPLNLVWMINNIWFAVAFLAIFLALAIFIGVIFGGTSMVLGVFGLTSGTAATASDYAASGYTDFRQSAAGRAAEKFGNWLNPLSDKWEDFLHSNLYSTCEHCYHLNELNRGGGGDLDITDTTGGGGGLPAGQYKCQNCGKNNSPGMP